MRFARAASVAAACVFAPILLTGRWLTASVLGLILAVAAIGLNFLSGTAGQLSLGQGALVGVGAMTAAVLGGATRTGLSTDALIGYELPAAVWLPAAGGVAALAGLIIAPAAARLRGLSLGIVTIGLVFLGAHVFATATRLTGGANGRGIPELSIAGHELRDPLHLFGVEFGRDRQWFYASVIVLGAAYLFMRNLLGSRFGRACASVRDRDRASLAVGIDVTRVKLVAFAVASVYAGICGALFGSYLGRVVGSTQFDLLFSIQLVVIVIVGGLGSPGGAIAGSIFVTLLPVATTELRPFFPFLSDTGSTGFITGDEFAVVLYGVVLIAVLALEPRGLAGLWLRAKASVRAWPMQP